MTMNESELAEWAIDLLNDGRREIHLEEPFNHYGDRGVVDLYTRDPGPPDDDMVIEFKSDSAIEEATGANSIIRQFKKQIRYFYEDDKHSPPRVSREFPNYPGVTFRLMFAPTVRCVEHLGEYLTSYRSIESEVQVGRATGVVNIGIVNPEGQNRWLWINKDISEELVEHAVANNSQLASVFEEATVTPFDL